MATSGNEVGMEAGVGRECVLCVCAVCAIGRRRGKRPSL